MIESSLKRIGLTDGEIKIYLALLELGSSTTWNITKKSGISGSKVYEVLDRLSKKGLASYTIKNNVRYFEAASPERILDFLEGKSKELESEKNEIKKIIPELILKQVNSAKAEVKVYTGFEGAKTVYDINVKDCKKGDEMLGWGLTEQPESWETYFNEKEKVRDKMGIVYKMILNEKYQSLYNARKKFKNTHFRFFPRGLEMPASVITWKNKVALYVITKEPITIIIESEAVAESFRKYFHIMWKQAKKNIPTS
ncbi:hypothetical protein A3K73_03005 [Candidatus Pacearchaeota archaeon RBG_13_36_9]|nr:MAG: hypothetical protein A3K73_03005 [Candidatus Pacearchaeota archaeon RBG_13_36_9]